MVIMGAAYIIIIFLLFQIGGCFLQVIFTRLVQLGPGVVAVTKKRWLSLTSNDHYRQVSFSGFSVGFSINEEGYLLPTIARKITWQRFD